MTCSWLPGTRDIQGDDALPEMSNLISGRLHQLNSRAG